MSEIELKKEEQRIELINDLAATSTVMDEIWRYHPDNPKKVNVVDEYKALVKMQEGIELEIKKLDASS